MRQWVLLEGTGILSIKTIPKLLGTGILVFLTVLTPSLQAQNSKIEFDLFGLNCFPFQEVSRYSYNFNVYGDSWDSYQDMSFEKSSPHFGFGAGLTYWIQDHLGLRFQALSWKTQQTGFDNLVSIRYSYYPWYSYSSDQPVDVSYDFKGKVPPELDYRTSAFSLRAVWRTKIGLSPSELKQTPTELLLNPSRFRLTFVLAIKL